MKIWVPLFLFFTAFVSACVKAPSYPIVPAIEFKSVSSDFIKSGSLDTIVISFTDGDGDIGVNSSVDDSCNQCAWKTGDSCSFKMRGFNIFLIDSRDTCVETYASANIPSNGRFPALTGEILVIRAIDSKTCFAPPTPGCPLDSVVYTIILRDKAGHFSNAVETPAIYIDGE